MTEQELLDEIERGVLVVAVLAKVSLADERILDELGDLLARVLELKELRNVSSQYRKAEK